MLMLLQDKQNGTLVEILDIEALFKPTASDVRGQQQAGEEEQDPASYPKANLKFPSGEELPRCWTDANYRNAK
jgi:hypothetical protein